MPSCSPTRVERRRPALGTTVAIRLQGLGQDAAHAAISAAFADVVEVHCLMSFQEPGSELSRLNREAAKGAVPVSPAVREVLAEALRIARASDGAFDPTCAGPLVQAGALPAPADAPAPDPGARWGDVELEGACVRFRRPLWLDLSGIAKGYAVDRACARLRDAGATQGAVNAGGDLRLFGPEAESIILDSGVEEQSTPAIVLQDGAMASSGRAERDAGTWARHLDPRSGRLLPQGRFAAVVAPTAMAADGLTKAALVLGDAAADALLAAEEAFALVRDAAGWRTLGRAA